MSARCGPTHKIEPCYSQVYTHMNISAHTWSGMHTPAHTWTGMHTPISKIKLKRIGQQQILLQTKLMSCLWAEVHWPAALGFKESRPKESSRISQNLGFPNHSLQTSFSFLWCFIISGEVSPSLCTRSGWWLGFHPKRAPSKRQEVLSCHSWERTPPAGHLITS